MACAESISAVRRLAESRIEEPRKWLDGHGDTIVESGTLLRDETHASLHTDYGPPDQDKTAFNQDYVLAWSPNEKELSQRIRWVIAMADGLTSAYASESGAAIACWSAAHELARRLSTTTVAQETESVARAAVRSATEALQSVVDELETDERGTCPHGVFPRTWGYMLRRGRLLQTTLSVAWIDARTLHLVIVGDGGALWSEMASDGTEPTARILARCDPDTHEVIALGPRVGEIPVRLFHCCCDIRVVSGRPFVFALYTDGLDRGLARRNRTLLDELDVHSPPETHLAEQYLKGVIRDNAADFNDNLSLAVLRGQMQT